ncbi:MAG: ABC transporter permease [Actinomycetota bacterium]|nr:ABC transporter permease [Actinomycetota bacterium]
MSQLSLEHPRGRQAAERRWEGGWPERSLVHLRPLRVILEDRVAMLGLAIVLLFMIAAVAAPLLSPHDPLAISGDRLEGPSLSHPLGTDALGRDFLSRLLHGARLSLGSAVLAAVLVMTIGLLGGTLAGFYGGLFDTVLMRVVDVILAFPGLILALAIAGLFRPGILPIMLGLVSVWWVRYARIIRGLVLAIREREFIASARSLGAGDLRIITRHVLPHVVSPLIVLITLEMGTLVLAISGLNFLGLGAQPPTPEWGAMLNEGRTYFLSAPRMVLVPGVAITLAVLGFNLVGDGIRDMLDPKLR